MTHFLSLWDLPQDQLQGLLQEALRMKLALARGERPPLLAGRVLGLVFEKPSLRTRVSFEAGMAQLGGSSVFLSNSDGAMGVRESVPDYARTLSQYADAVVLRTFKHTTVETFAAFSACPVINGLSDLHHPCQALADLMTVQEVFGELRGKTIAFIGDGNNVARSLAAGCGRLNARFVLSAPEGYGFDRGFLTEFRQHCNGAVLDLQEDPHRAVREADVIYTDVWTSMGQEAEHEQRLRQFAPYQVNDTLLQSAPKHARLMHCLPARRGEEVSEDVLDGAQSVVFLQAANRMHAQKALLCHLIGKR